MTTSATGHPVLIQGGMGVAISSWQLAKIVAQRGHLGVISGTAIDWLIACRLQEGDEDGHLRRAFDAFPDRELADRIYARYHRPEGLPAPGVYHHPPMFSVPPDPALLELGVIASFAEVWLAKEGHAGPVGINLLEKLQFPTLPVIYGAILAGVDYIIMGAGIPREIPKHIDALCRHQPAELKLILVDGSTEPLPFDPGIIKHHLGPMPKPQFLAIISSNLLARALARAEGFDGFIVEGPTAGGHNAPPRGWTADDQTEPIYGPADVVDLERLATLGIPFWLAGDQGYADSLAQAQARGAVGIQVGTAFAFCSDSGMDPQVRRRIVAAALAGETIVTNTEGRCSPTGFPFKVVDFPDTDGGRPADERIRQPCKLGYLRSPYRLANGRIGWRCAAEPVEPFLSKGGDSADLAGRRCLCNGLLANSGRAQPMREGGMELPIVTAGDVGDLRRFLRNGNTDFDANAVIDYLVHDAPADG